MNRLLPDGIVGRVTLLLLGALLCVNFVAALLLAREGSGFDRAIRLHGDMGRLIALVGAMEKVDGTAASAMLASSATGFTRFSIDEGPLAHMLTEDAALGDQLATSLPGHAVRASVDGETEGGARAMLMVLSVQLNEGVHAGRWLNSLVYPLPPTAAWHWKIGFFAPLAASLFATLAVSLLFIRKLTAPLRELAQAALKAGYGDRTVQVSERGARELREAASAFNDMQRRIAHFDAERMRLIAAVGHDLRTPITSLRIRAELMDDDAEREAMIRILGDMDIMAEDLMHYGKGATGVEATQSIDLERLLHRLATDTGARLGSIAPAAIHGRPVALSRALGNLISNALRYGGEAVVGLQCIKSEAVVTIDDKGHGIPSGQIEAMMEPFVRGDDSRSLETGGIGLGLSIARSIVEDHGGHLTLENRASGLRATVRLPSA